MKSWLRDLVNFVVKSDESDKTHYYEDYAKSFFPTKKITERDLINLESRVGSFIFGEVPKGHKREFFNLDPDTWIWYEEWVDEKGELVQQTIRYEVSENQVLKVCPGLRYSILTGEELSNFRLATEEYYRRVMAQVYRI